MASHTYAQLRTLMLLVALLISGMFISQPVAAQVTCGSIIDLSNEFNDIEDCDNPFEAHADFPFTFIFAGSLVSEGATYEIPLDATYDILLQSTGEDDDVESVQLFRQAGQDFHEVAVDEVSTGSEYQTLLVDPGTYTLVLNYDVPLVTQGGDSWWQKVQNLFVSVALADTYPNSKVFTRTFTIIEPQVDALCGFIIYPGVYEDVIEDCEYPLGIPHPNTGLQVTFANQVITGDEQYTFLNAPGTFVLTGIDPAANGTRSILYRHDGENFVVEQDGLDEYTFTATGTYSIVVTEIDLVVSDASLLQQLRELLVSTAHAAIGDRTIITFAVVDQPTQSPGASSVLFLPGIQASRLYKDGLLGQDQVWPPNSLFNNDVNDLRMNTSGVSEEEIYTSDVIDTSAGVGDVYAGFERFLTDLDTSEVIEDWESFAYDWRYSVTDIVQNGTQYEDGVRSAIDKIQDLADDSFSGQVTIIGHSNGGLLAKAIMQRLEDDGKANMVDRVIFLATPQLGTPKAIGTILHGYDQTDKFGGFIINAQNARKVINNLPGAYGLLPSEDYFNDLSDPLVTFADSVSTAPYRSVYGSSISNYADFVDFVRGEDGLDRDIENPVATPARANGAMLDDALSMHTTQLDNWVAPEGVEVVEIVGTGLPTMKSVEYRENVEDKCITAGPAGIICTPEAEIKPYAVLTKYGDSTVVQRSAEAYGGEKRRYFINLEALNQAREDQSLKSVFHHSITESAELQDFLLDILVSTTTENNQFISTSHIEFTDLYDIEIIDSPVRLLATDSLDNQTGIVIIDGVETIKEEIPGSQYFEFGDTKYFVVPKGTDRITRLYGEDYGGYTLTTAVLGAIDVQTVESVLLNATATPSLVAEYSNTNGEFSTITTDLDGDGVVDLETTLDGEIIAEEVVTTYPLLITTIEGLSLPKIRKQALKVLVKSAEYYSEKTPPRPLYQRLEDAILKTAQELVKHYLKKGYLTDGEAATLEEMIQELIDKQ